MAVSIDSNKSLDEMLSGDKLTGGTKAKDSLVMMTNTCLAASDRWQAMNHYKLYLDRNKGKGKGEAWDMATPSEAEIRAALPAHIVQYIDQDGQAESDGQVAQMVVEAAIVCKEPSAVGAGGGVVVNQGAAVTLRPTPGAEDSETI